MVSESEDSISDPLHLISSHSSEVVGYGIFTLFVSFITGALCWHFLDYAGRGPVQGEFRTVLAAYSLAVVGALSTMCQGLIVHLFAPQLTVMEALLWSSVVRFVLSAPFVIFDISKFSASAAAEDKEPLLRKEVKVEDVPAYHRYAMLALRGLMGTFGGHLALYWGVQFLLPSEGAALWSTAPFFALIFGFIILGEKLPMLTVAMIVFGFVGVLLVIQPVELVSWVWTGGLDMVDFTHTAACFLVLAGGACQGILGPMMRALKWTVFEVVAWTAAAGILVALLLSALFQPAGLAACAAWVSAAAAVAPWAALGWVVLLGVTSLFSTYFLNWAWQLEPAGPVDMVNMSFFVGAMLVFQLAVLEEASNAWAVAGVVVIVAAAAALIYSRLSARFDA